VEQPIACTLSADDARERVEEWRRFFARSVDGVRQLSGNRFRFHLDGDAAEVSEAVDLARREKACCPFFDFSIQIDSDSYWLVVAVPPEASGVLEDFARLASPRRA
jgi:hypothetical protein